MRLDKMPEVLKKAQELQEQAEELKKVKKPNKADVIKIKKLVKDLTEMQQSIADMELPFILTRPIAKHIIEIQKMAKEWEKQFEK